MNGIQLNAKARHLDKPVPGCLGRMVDFFDLAPSKNRLLTDKPHNDGAYISKSRSDGYKMSSSAINEMQDEVITEWSSLSKKSHGTPVKMLLAQEISKDLESKQKTPNVVARLMGLDALPPQLPGLTGQRSENCRQQEEHYYFREQNDYEVNSHQEQSDFRDIYGTWRQSQRNNCKRDKSLQKGSCNENTVEKRLALIRQKFMEAKRLATDEKLCQTKEFQDALDVLSSNGELFLKVLQESNSLFSHHLYAGQSIPPPAVAKQITVLRPSKMIDDKFSAPDRRDEKKANKQVQVSSWNNHIGFSPTLSIRKANDRPEPTRIVVLKPSAAKLNDSNILGFSSPSSPRILHNECFLEGFEEKEAQEARVMAKETIHQMRENLGGHKRDETLLSSALSNGYTGDESSFDKFENEFTTGNLSDSEIMSPISRHSWEYANRYGNPYSLSSFSRASYSPESSICREAKRRLSERWAMIASNGYSQEPSRIRKSSSTLGEMLALSEICEENDNLSHDPGGARGSGDVSPRSPLRLKSLIVSPSAYGDGMNNEASNPSLCREDTSRDMIRAKAPKSSFTEKVASLFFPRYKKSKNVKPSKTLLYDTSQVVIADTSGSLAPSGRVCNDQCEAVLSSSSQRHCENIMRDLNNKRQAQGMGFQEKSCIPEPSMPEIQGENHQQPSPISVLDQPFEEDRGAFQPSTHGKSNLIDKSPPIGSIARTLSWDECSTKPITIYPLNPPFASSEVDHEEEWHSLVESLFTMAGLYEAGKLEKNFNWWYSLESPLNPSLRDKYVDLTAKEPLHEANQRQLRSTRKLVFDCVNGVLVKMTCIRQSNKTFKMLMEIVSAELADEVWDQVREWVSGNVKCPSDEDGGDSGSLVEKEVMKEVMGKGWADEMRMEVENIGKEIEGKLLQELLEESLVEWTVRKIDGTNTLLIF